MLFVPTAPRYGNLAHLAICSLQQYGRSSHRHDDHDGAHYQPSSPPSPCPCRPIALLLRVVCGALGCPARLFFLLGFLRVSDSLPLGYGAGVVVALAVCAHPHGARSARYTTSSDAVAMTAPASWKCGALECLTQEKASRALAWLPRLCCSRQRARPLHPLVALGPTLREQPIAIPQPSLERSAKPPLQLHA